MPQIVIKGVNKESVEKFCKEMINELKTATDTPENYFSVQLSTNTFVFNEYPIIEIYWFERPQEIKDRFAEIVYKYFSELSDTVDIIFYKLSKESYYENNVHF